MSIQDCLHQLDIAIELNRNANRYLLQVYYNSFGQAKQCFESV